MTDLIILKSSDDNAYGRDRRFEDVREEVVGKDAPRSENNARKGVREEVTSSKRTHKKYPFFKCNISGASALPLTVWKLHPLG